MNVDDEIGKSVDKLGGQNLHVARQHNKLNLVLAQQLPCAASACFSFAAVTATW